MRTSHPVFKIAFLTKGGVRNGDWVTGNFMGLLGNLGEPSGVIEHHEGDYLEDHPI